MNVLRLGLASFLNDISSEIILPIMPMFILSLGGSPVIIGLLAGSRNAIENLSNIFIGHWSDKIGYRKIFVSSGYFLSSGCKFLLSLAKWWPAAFVFASVERVGKGFRKTPIDTIIAESSRGKIGLGFGVHRAFDTCGAVIGSLASFVLLSYFHFSYHTIILVAAFIGFFALLPIRWVAEVSRIPVKIPLLKRIKAFSPELKNFFFISGLFSLGYFSYMFFLMKIHSVFIGKPSIVMPVFLYFISNVFYAAGSIPIGMLGDKIGRSRMLICGYVLFSIISISFIVSRTISVFILLFVLYGLVRAIVGVNQRAYVTSIANIEDRAVVLGALHTMTGTIMLLSNFIAGVLWQYALPEATFMFGAIVSILAALLLFLKKEFYFLS